MQKGLGRRAFIGSAAAGVPAIVGGTLVWAQSGDTVPHTHAAGGSIDPIDAHLLGELGRVCNDAQSNGARAEHARACAAHIRTMAVYRRATGRDEESRRRLRVSVEDRGRDAIVSARPDFTRAATELAPFGVDLDLVDLRSIPEPAYAARVATLDAVLAGGASHVWEQLADFLERHADVVERRGRTIHPIARQIDQQWCDFLAANIEVFWSLASVFCGLTWWDPIFVLDCSVAIALLYFAAMLYLYTGCFF